MKIMRLAAQYLLSAVGTLLKVGDIPDGSFLKRVGDSIIGTAGISATSRIAVTSGNAVHAIYPPVVNAWSSGVAFNLVTVTDGDGSYDIYAILDLTRTAGGAAAQQGGQIRIRALRTAGTLAIRHSAMSSYLASYAPTYNFGVSGDTVTVTVTSAGSSGEVMTAVTLACAATDLES